MTGGEPELRRALSRHALLPHQLPPQQPHQSQQFMLNHPIAAMGHMGGMGMGMGVGMMDMNGMMLGDAMDWGIPGMAFPAMNAMMDPGLVGLSEESDRRTRRKEEKEDRARGKHDKDKAKARKEKGVKEKGLKSKKRAVESDDMSSVSQKRRREPPPLKLVPTRKPERKVDEEDL